MLILVVTNKQYAIQSRVIMRLCFSLFTSPFVEQSHVPHVWACLLFSNAIKPLSESWEATCSASLPTGEWCPWCCRPLINSQKSYSLCAVRETLWLYKAKLITWPRECIMVGRFCTWRWNSGPLPLPMEWLKINKCKLSKPFLQDERGNTNNLFGFGTLLQSLFALYISHELCEVGTWLVVCDL